MAWTTLIQVGEQMSASMLQRLLGQQYYGLPATTGVGTGFNAGSVGIMNGATGSDPNHYAVLADGTDMVLTIRGGWALIVKDSGSSSFDPRTYFVENSSPITYTVPSNSSGTTRVDTICLRVDQSITPDATGSNLATIYNVQGGASSALGNAPSDGALYYPLALVTVTNGATSLSSGNVTDKRAVAPTAGSTVVSTKAVASGFSPLSGSVSLPIIFKGGITQITTDSGGNGILTFTGGAFPNGVICCVGINGNAGADQRILIAQFDLGTSLTTSTWKFRAANATTNGVFANYTLDVAWIALGW